jgi:putative addiction module killer protein
MHLDILRTREFLDWFVGLTVNEQLQIDSRIQRIQDHGHFGDVKNIGNGLAELRWKSGRRIYFTRVGQVMILLLNGGLKNAQKKDIKKARVLLERYADFKDQKS